MAEQQRVSFLTWLNTTYIRFTTWRRGELVGTDRFGNRYFRERQARPGMRQRRWVLYNGEPEASKVPAEWYGWLRHTNAEPLPETGPTHRPWQKEHVPNLTGTVNAYRPAGHPLRGGERPPATGDYEPWVPN